MLLKKLRNFSRFSDRDRRLLIKTFILLGLIRLGFVFLPYQALQQRLEKISQPPQSPLNPIPVDKIVWAVNMSSYYMPALCLARALTTKVLMNQQGYTPLLRIGVTKGQPGKLEAHAWVEYQGEVVIGNLPNLSQFNALLPAEPKQSKPSLS